jgi:putative DNA methylase
MMNTPYKKKLIEVAIPLEAINTASAREKSIRHGHPSTLHLWWARRPLAACRAVLFAQLVDDPSGYTDKLLENPKIRERAEADLAVRLQTWRERKVDAHGNLPDTPEPTLEDCAADIERKRLFEIIEDLVKWENSTNEEVLERARTEIRRSCGGVMPPVYDPFSGGGSIPLEAQRLGLPAYGSDLNPVAVMIGKAMIEIPPKFKDNSPIHPGAKDRQFYRNAEGLAEDVKYYGEWMREKAWERIGHLYPKVDLPKEHGGGKGTVIAWIWARTVASPDPAFGGAHVPLVSSFLLSAYSGREAIAVPIVDKASKSIDYSIKHGPFTARDLEVARLGTKAGKAQDFICLLSNTPITRAYIREQGKAGLLGQSLVAIVAEGKGGRAFCPPQQQALLTNIEAVDALQFARDTFLSGETPTRAEITGGVCSAYGLTTWGHLFSDRQLNSLLTFSSLFSDLRKKIEVDARSSASDLGKSDGLARSYAEAVSIYLSFALGRLADRGSTICSWDSSRTILRNTFARQGIPMTWDYAEGNPFSDSTGNWSSCCEWIWKVIENFVPASAGVETQQDAQNSSAGVDVVISTDPPYYDNIAYSTLSDFFYCWLRPALRDIAPDIFGVLSTPKAEELVAIASRHGGREGAEDFFITGMTSALRKMASQSIEGIPATIYYAFKQSEIKDEGVSSTGWATFLQAVIEAGYSVVGTWPIRTEMANRMIASGTNALANSVVLVCRKKEISAAIITRAEFIRALKRELPPAIAELQAANIAPADMPQSAIGPGMGVFSRYKAVLESDDRPMAVKTALQLINRELDEYLGGIQGEFDPDTRFAITWFEQNGNAKGEYGVADNLARARGISVESVKHAGIIESSAGKVRILTRDELSEEWDPEGDSHLTVWECLQHLVKVHEKDGISLDAAVLLKKIGNQAEAVKDLAYCLYDISANKRKDAKEATAYNALIADWTELTRQAAAAHDTRRDGQMRFDV